MASASRLALTEEETTLCITDMLVHYNEPNFLAEPIKNPFPAQVVSAVTRPSTAAYTPKISHWKAYGLHPMWADEDAQQEFAILRKRCALLEVDLIGEIGLDGRADFPSMSAQSKIFEGQLALALEYDLPVILHIVKAHSQSLDSLANHPRLRAMVHGFTRAPEVALPFINRGFYIGLGPAILSPKNKRARRCAMELPLDKILVESDSPSAYPGGENATPHLVFDVVKEIAHLRGMGRQEVAAAIERNREAFLPSKGLTKVDNQ